MLLVRERPHEPGQESASEQGDPNKDPFCAFWKGDDPRIHAELCSVLDEAGIRHNTVYRKDHLFNLSNYATFQVGVPASRFEEAENAIRDAFAPDSAEGDAADALTPPRLLLDRNDRTRKLPEMMSPEENMPGPEGPGDSAEWFLEDANALVWSGEDGYLASVILAAFNENDLHARREAQESTIQLIVFSSEEARAGEIVREIIESTPSE